MKMTTKTQKIMVTKPVHDFNVKIIGILSKKLLAKGYTAIDLQQKIDAKIDAATWVKWLKQAFENGLTAEQAASNFVNILRL